jgi:hypothetical protein
MNESLLKSLNYWKKNSFSKNLKEIKEKMNDNKVKRYYYIEIKDNKIITFIPHKCEIKDIKRKEILKFFFNKILSKFKLNDCFFFIIAKENYYNNYGKKNDFEHFPFFVQQKYNWSDLLLIPDAFFLNDYSKSYREKKINPEKSLHQQILNFNKNIDYKDKIDKIVFRSWNKKYFPLGKLKNDHANIVSKAGGCPINHEGQHKYKYHLSLYQRWDTIYMNLLSNSIPIIVDNKNDKNSVFNYETFYKYFIQEGVDYIHSDINNIEDTVKKIKNKESDYIDISDSWKNLETKLSYDNIIDNYGNFLVEYSKLF